MDFGALQPQTPFDKSLALINPASIAWLKKLETQFHTTPLFCVGLPQWTIPGFCKTLPAYAQTLKSIELNSSFYKIPSIEQVLRWKEQSGIGFRFFVKMHQSLSHDRFLWTQHEILKKQLDQFLKIWGNLGENLGGYFLQLPPQIEIKDLSLIENWIRTFRLISDANLNIELRHDSWFLNRQVVSSAARVFAAHQVGVVCSDTPGKREVSHSTLTTQTWMVRFLGQSTVLHSDPLQQDLQRLELWANHLKEIQPYGLKQIIFFIHTPDHFWAPKLVEHWNALWDIQSPIFKKNSEVDLQKQYSLSIF